MHLNAISLVIDFELSVIQAPWQTFRQLNLRELINLQVIQGIEAALHVLDNEENRFLFLDACCLLQNSRALVWLYIAAIPSIMAELKRYMVRRSAFSVVPSSMEPMSKRL